MTAVETVTGSISKRNSPVTEERKVREWDFFVEYGVRKATGIDATESTVIESAAHSYLEWLVLEYLQVNQIRAYSSLEIPTYLCYDSAS